MDNKKSSKKRIAFAALRVLAFVLAFFLVINALSATYFAKDRTEKYSDTKYYYASVYKSEKQDSIQVGFFGNSDLYSGVIPLSLFYQYGITSTVCASPRQDVNDSYWYIKDFLSDQTPDVIVIESDMFFTGSAGDFYKKGTEKSSGLPSVPFFNDNSLDNYIESTFPIFRFHDRWKEYLKPIKSFYNSYMHGYYYNDKVYSNVKESSYMYETDLAEPIATDYISYAKSVKSLCDSYGAELMFLEIATPASWSYARHNSVQALADELDIPFLDLNFPYKDFEIDLENDYRDNGNHVNYYGAKKVSEYVGCFIKENYELEDLRENPDYTSWYEDIDKMYEEYNISEKNRLTAASVKDN